VLVPTYLESREVAYPLAPPVRFHFLADLGDFAGRSRAGILIEKLRAVRRLVRDFRPDVVVAFLPSIAMLAIVATRGTGVPVIVSERTDPAGGAELPWFAHVARLFLYPLAEQVVAQTRQAADRFERRLLGLCSVGVVPNPLPAELEVFPLSENPGATPGLVLAVGRLSSEKGFDRLIVAFAHAFADLPGWRLEIWGDGPHKAALQRVIDRQGLGERVKLKGKTDHPWEVMSGAQIFALTSEFEGFPNAMLEAMALGVATVAFDCNSGPRDLTDGGRVGVLVPPADVAALARALRALADDAVQRVEMGHAGAGFVRSAFSEAAVLARWDTLFSSILARRTS
jgi:glycosyltransferase involved in cell wall biosynthesis